jgi:hypothetical protein
MTWSDLLLAVLTACVPPVAYLVSVACHRLAANLGVDTALKDQTLAEGQYKAAIGVGVAKAVKDAKGDVRWDGAWFQDVAMNTAVAYMQERFPDRTRKIVDAAAASTTNDVADAVKETLSGRLPDVVTAAAASPATPPAVVTAEPIVVERGTRVVQ